MIEKITMDQNECFDLQKVVDDMVYLLSCAVNNTAPDSALVNQMNYDSIYELASFHSVAATVAFALEKSIELPHEFDQIKKKNIRKLALYDTERNKIISCFKKEKIWFMPLKGIILKDYYPKFGMREMSDNDILCDPSRMSDIKDIMESLGYICDEFGEYNHDVYTKQFISFEMHSSLFFEKDYSSLSDYYKDIKSRLICFDDSLEYRFKPEDLYIYLLAHAYKHFIGRGTGIRSLLDTYVFLKRHREELDWNYLNEELTSLSLTEFEKMNREISEKLFSGGYLNDENKQRFLYYVSSGVYGTEEHACYNRVYHDLSGDDSKKAKRDYLNRRFFLQDEELKKRYPYIYHHKFLQPGLFIYRIIKAIFVKPRRIWKEYKQIANFRINK